MNRKPPSITNAPGINWMPRKDGQWKALWRARADLTARGYLPKAVGIWIGTPDELDSDNIKWIQTRANDLQSDMLAWGRGGVPTMITTMVVLEINSWYQLWRVRPAAAYMIPNPQPRGHPCNVPADLDPGKKWTGFVRNRQDEPKRVDFRDGWHYVGVYTTARNRPYLKRIRRVMKKAA